MFDPNHTTHGRTEVLRAQIEKLQRRVKSLEERANGGTKPVIPWDYIHLELNWVARDKGGVVAAYIDKPEVEGDEWCAPDRYNRMLDDLLVFDPGTCDWKDSLVERPK